MKRALRCTFQKEKTPKTTMSFEEKQKNKKKSLTLVFTAAVARVARAHTHKKKKNPREPYNRFEKVEMRKRKKEKCITTAVR